MDSWGDPRRIAYYCAVSVLLLVLYLAFFVSRWWGLLSLPALVVTATLWEKAYPKKEAPTAMAAITKSAKSRPIDPEWLYIARNFAFVAGGILLVVSMFSSAWGWVSVAAFGLGGWLWRKAYTTKETFGSGTAHTLPVDINRQAELTNIRQAQLAALRASVPTTVPQRMRATIQVNSYKAITYEQEQADYAGGGKYAVRRPVERFVSSVDMILELSEAERALIKQYELFEIVLEDVPFFSQDEITARTIEAAQELRAMITTSKETYLRKAIKEEIDTSVVKSMKHERRKTRVGDLLVAPFSRDFNTPTEANDYAVKIKSDFLPKVRQLLDRYRDNKPSETIEF